MGAVVLACLSGVSRHDMNTICAIVVVWPVLWTYSLAWCLMFGFVSTEVVLSSHATSEAWTSLVVTWVCCNWLMAQRRSPRLCWIAAGSQEGTAWRELLSEVEPGHPGCFSTQHSPLCIQLCHCRWLLCLSHNKFIVLLYCKQAFIHVYSLSTCAFSHLFLLCLVTYRFETVCVRRPRWSFVWFVQYCVITVSCLMFSPLAWCCRVGHCSKHCTDMSVLWCCMPRVLFLPAF